VLGVESQLFAELVSVGGTQVDLKGVAVKTKRYGLDRLAAVKIVDEKYLNLLCHGTSPSGEQAYFRYRRYTHLVAVANSGGVQIVALGEVGIPAYYSRPLPGPRQLSVIRH
jgi:hypothetical protein